jgi:hypothetical protein
MKARNATYTSDGRIDCEIEHPQYGWIPFTADPDDPEKHGRDIFAALVASGDVRKYVAPKGPTKAERLATEREQIAAQRRAAMTSEADPLFFEWQAGEATEAEWKAKRQEIKARFPMPDEKTS